MKEAIYIKGQDCAKCRFLEPHVSKWCDENGYNFQGILFDDESVKHFSVNAIPMLVLREDGIPTAIHDEEGIVNLISNKQ